MGRTKHSTFCEQCPTPTTKDRLVRQPGEKEPKVDSKGFMTVGFFDATPGTFDNEMFKDLAQNTFDNIPDCSIFSAKYKKRYARKGWRKRNPGAQPPKDMCSSPVKWCNASNARDHRKSRMVNMFQWPSFKGQSKRLVRLPAFWALLSDERTKS